jgi:hypothetical protein
MAKQEQVPEVTMKSVGDTAETKAIVAQAQDDNVKKFEEDFIKIPTELVPLPSKGLIYPLDSSLHNATHIEVRHMTAQEEDILTSRTLLRSGKAIDMILANCIQDKSINPADLVSGDKNAVMIALRVTGYGSDYTINVTCPQCEEQSKFEFDLGALEMNTLEVNPVTPGANLFEFTLPTSETAITFRFLTSGEEREVSETQEKVKKRMNSQIDKNVTATLKSQLVSVNGKEDQALINQLVDALHVKDSRALRKFIDDAKPDVLMKQFFSCPNCSESSEVDVPITGEFFWPDA